MGTLIESHSTDIDYQVESRSSELFTTTFPEDKTIPMTIHKIYDSEGDVYYPCEIGFAKERTVGLDVTEDDDYIDLLAGRTPLAKGIGEIITKYFQD